MSICSEKETIIFVRGRGDPPDPSNDNGGGCTKQAWESALGQDLDNVMTSDGGPLSDSGAWGGKICDVVNNGSGKVRIRKTGYGFFINCKVGNIANVDFAATYYDDRYEVIAVDTGSGDWVDIELAYSADTTCDCRVGGALATLQHAVDNVDAVNYTHEIRAYSGELLTAAIDLDTYGGSGTNGTWLKVIGVDDTGAELADGNYSTYNAQNNACHVLNIHNVDNIEFRHIYAKDAGATQAGFNFTMTAAHHGFVFYDCKSTDCYYAMLMATANVRKLLLIQGYYEASGITLYLIAPMGVHLIDVEVVNNTSYAGINFYPYGEGILEGCIIKKNGSGDGIYCDYQYSLVNVRNCVFYNVGDAISIDHNDCRLIEYNNIYMVGAKATGKVIDGNQGRIAYSDYSCLWALDGAPEATNRWGGTSTPPTNAVEQDPQFVNAASDDFRLKPSSPCLNTGKPTVNNGLASIGAWQRKSLLRWR